MNIYVAERERECNQYDGFVVSAESEEDALSLVKIRSGSDYWSIEDLGEIGVANTSEQEVFLDSYTTC